MKKNLFIAFEGIDGSGKSTQAKLLAEHLRKAGHPVYATAEPTGGPIGSLVRNIFKHRIDADHSTIAALFAADRLDHLQNKSDGVLQKIRDGYTVIMDRYYFSSYAYHSLHVPMEWVIQTNSISAGLLRPDLNIYIDISPEASMKRLNSGRHVIELYESLENLRDVREKYLEAFERLKNEEQIMIVDGDRAPEVIAADILTQLVRKGMLPALQKS